MNLSAADIRIQRRSSLVADICLELRCGQDPSPLLMNEMEIARGNPEDEAFITRICQVLRPEEAPR